MHEAFLHTIIENPADDTPRLAYADWLDEQGDERGKFVRVQIELAKYKRDFCPNQNRKGLPKTIYGLPVVIDGGGCGTCRWCELVAIAHKLLDGNWPEWAALPGFRVVARTDRNIVILNHEQSGARLDGRFVRGFIEEVKIDAEYFLCHADAIRRCAPLRKVVLTAPPKLDIQRDRSVLNLNKPWVRKVEVRLTATVRWGRLLPIILAFAYTLAKKSGVRFQLYEDEAEAKLQEAMKPENLLPQWFPGIEFEMVPRMTRDGLPRYAEEVEIARDPLALASAPVRIAVPLENSPRGVHVATSSLSEVE